MRSLCLQRVASASPVVKPFVAMMSVAEEGCPIGCLELALRLVQMNYEPFPEGASSVSFIGGVG